MYITHACEHTHTQIFIFLYPRCIPSHFPDRCPNKLFEGGCWKVCFSLSLDGCCRLTLVMAYLFCLVI